MAFVSVSQTIIKKSQNCETNWNVFDQHGNLVECVEISSAEKQQQKYSLMFMYVYIMAQTSTICHTLHFKSQY